MSEKTAYFLECVTQHAEQNISKKEETLLRHDVIEAEY